MARPLRIEYAGALLPCDQSRATGGRPSSPSRRDYELFLERLGQFSGQFEVRLLCYCCMPNHFHLYLRTEQANLSRFMQSLLTSFTISPEPPSRQQRPRLPGPLHGPSGRERGVWRRGLPLHPSQSGPDQGPAAGLRGGPTARPCVPLRGRATRPASACRRRPTWFDPGAAAGGLGRRADRVQMRRYGAVRRGRPAAGPGQPAGPTGGPDDPGDGDLRRPHSADVRADAKRRQAGAAGVRAGPPVDSF